MIILAAVARVGLYLYPEIVCRFRSSFNGTLRHFLYVLSDGIFVDEKVEEWIEEWEHQIFPHWLLFS